jgi:hypothetical protein
MSGVARQLQEFMKSWCEQPSAATSCFDTVWGLAVGHRSPHLLLHRSILHVRKTGRDTFEGLTG